MFLDWRLILRVKIIDDYCGYLNTKFDKFSWETNAGLSLCFLVVFASLLLFIIPIVIIVRADFSPTYALLTFIAWGSIEFLLFSCCVVSADVVYKKLSKVVEERKKEK